MNILPFWDEEYTPTLKHALESKYHHEIIREWYISEIVINGDKTLIKWNKRMSPLSDEYLKEKYGYDL